MPILSIRNVRVGDIVECIHGKLNGVRAKVIATRPGKTYLATQIKVHIDTKKYKLTKDAAAYVYNAHSTSMWFSVKNWIVVKPIQVRVGIKT